MVRHLAINDHHEKHFTRWIDMASIDKTYSTANIKAVRGSLWSISVNKLSHIPKLQSVSMVYKKPMMPDLILCTYRVICP